MNERDKPQTTAGASDLCDVGDVLFVWDDVNSQRGATQLCLSNSRVHRVDALVNL